jgi:hypothetical protein
LIILIQSSGVARGEFGVDQELQRAFKILHVAGVRALGGGRFADGSGYVVLAREMDGPAALAVLEGGGVRALVLKPRIDSAIAKPNRAVERQR